MLYTLYLCVVLCFIILAVFFLGKWIITSVFIGLFGILEKEKEPETPVDTSPTVINFYTTENHLHVNDTFIKDLKK